MGELNKGTISYSHTIESFNFENNTLNTIITPQPFKEQFPKALELRSQFVNERDAIELPSYTQNIAIANGSAFGLSLDGNGCLAGLEANDVQSFEIPPNPFNPNNPFSLHQLQNIAEYLANSYSDDLLRLELNEIGGDSENIFLFNFIDQEKVEFNKISISNNSALDQLDLAPGCMRNDIDDIVQQLDILVEENPLNNPLNLGWASEFFIDFELSTLCNLENTTFMNTASTLGIDTDEYSANLDELFANNLAQSPFDNIYYNGAGINEPHVQVNDANTAFLVDIINDNKVFFGVNGAELPSETLGSTINFGRNYHRLSSFTINENAYLKINDLGSTGFVDVNPEIFTNLEFHSVVASSSQCDDTQITINKRGALILGAPENQFRSGILSMSTGTTLEVNKGGLLSLENKSQLYIREGATMTLNEGAIVTLNGQESTLVLEGHLKTTGDITIYVNGNITIEPSATFELGGTLTIIGDDMIDDMLILNNSSHAEISNNMVLENGTVKSINNGNIIVDGAEFVKLENVRVIPASPSSSFTGIELKNISDIEIIRSNFNSFCSYTGLLIENSTNVLIDQSDFSNSNYAAEIINVNQLSINSSSFYSTTNFCPQSPSFDDDNIIENNNGIYLKNIESVDITNSDFYDHGNGTSSSLAFGLRIEDISFCSIENSTFEGNGKGIYAPIHNGIGNESNLHIARSSFNDNAVGIEMYGQKATSSFDNNYGFLMLECVSLLANKVAGVKGYDILLQADSYFTLNEAGGNFFLSAPSALNFDIDYYQYSLHGYDNDEVVYLRGNFWKDDMINSHFYSHINDDIISVIADPMLTNKLPENCSSIQENDPEYCIDCFTSDENDCSLTTSAEGKTASINESYNNAINLLREKNESYEYDFQSIANIPLAEKENLKSKCNFQYEVSRVFALPTELETGGHNIGKRSSNSENYKIVPNPATSEITLEGIENGKDFIYSSTGLLIKSLNYEKNQSIDISSLASGLYFLKSNNSENVQKFIKID